MKQTILLFLSFSSIAFSAKAQTSTEIMCRNQAKELAAESYKNCVTEQRQTQVDQIRKEYQQKLSDLKSHYDGELKKVSGGQGPKKIEQQGKRENKTNKLAVIKRSSGARELPEKLVSSNTMKTEVIDFSTTTTKDTPTDDTTEIIEIPAE